MRFREIALLIIYIFFALCGMTLIKMGNSSSNGMIVMPCGYNLSVKMIAGIFFYGLSFLMYALIISKMQISLALPIVSAVNSVGIVLIGMIIFKETLNKGQILGVVTVIIGVLLIGGFSRN